MEMSTRLGGIHLISKDTQRRAELVSPQIERRTGKCRTGVILITFIPLETVGSGLNEEAIIVV